MTTIATLPPNPSQAFGKVASTFGVRHADKLIFGMVNRKQMSGFMETFNIYEGHPRVVVLVGIVVSMLPLMS